MSKVQMRKFETTVYSNTSISDFAQVPATATITVHKQGATVNQNATVTTAGAGVKVRVHGMGKIVNGSQLQVGTDDTQTLVVIATAGYPTENNGTYGEVYLQSTTGSSIALNAGQRLVITNDPPTIYSDPFGNTSLGNSVATSTTTGYCQFYTPERFFDYIVSGASLTARLFTDAESGYIGDKVVATDYPSLQAAVNDTPPGGICEIPPGVFLDNTACTFTPPLLLPTNKPMTLRGSGRDVTILKTTTSTAQNLIELRGDYQTIEDLTLYGPAQSGTGRGIQVGRVTADTTGAPLKHARIRNVKTINTASWGIAFYGPGTGGDAENGPKTAVDANSISVNCSLHNVENANAFSGGGVYVNWGCTTIYMDGGLITAWASGEGIRLADVTGCHVNNYILEAAVDLNYLYVKNATNCSFRNIWMEEQVGPGSPTKYMLQTTSFCNNDIFENLHFNRNSGATTVQKFANFAGNSMGIVVINVFGASVVAGATTDHIQVDAAGAADGNVCFLGYFYVQDGAGTPVRRPLIITDSGTVPRSSIFGHQRMRLPFLSSTDRDDTTFFLGKHKGDVIYNYSPPNVLQIYDGTKWRSFPTPILTSTQLAVAAEANNFQDGDSVYISDVPGFFDRVGSVWRIRTGTTLTTTQRDAATWTPANGDIIYNSTTAVYNIRLGAAWKVSSWT